MCIRDRYQRRVRGRGREAEMASGCDDSFLPVDQLRPQSGTLPGRRLVVLVFRVMVVAECVRPDGSRFRVAEAVVGDETGVITLSATNDQIELLIPGQALLLQDFKISLFKGCMRLGVDEWGSMELFSKKLFDRDPPMAVDLENDRSAIQFEVHYQSE
eukprot:TRINITY_DN21790_c0_g1_i1.p1 TRINITY_DN21790_c0_g1~~TRINITY_DN21790_c0_g1_i1.p1  ORF type:complete len:158 (+),score=42.22 TRINITY_DN21790_c0_g1_i1:190-663(+)